ncbi:MAG: IS1380 family transposase [Cellulomonas sp.]|uniref:IS1380 family transposase n=1 Tax=Cellulomonas sp. TaxID=40001 RepID=UPI00180636F7|nr:IS1380 family transposase [Cellulomonas sp.]NMM30065.1 IS1380 family transposase [Cellulomonas sp.]
MIALVTAGSARAVMPEPGPTGARGSDVVVVVVRTIGTHGNQARGALGGVRRSPPGRSRSSTSTLAIKATYGYQKEGAGYGYSEVKGLNALFAIISTPLSAPLIVATRLRKGSTYSPRGASQLVADALATAGRAGASGLITMRADSTYYVHDVIAAARRSGARFSVTARMDKAVSRTITQIPEDGWVPIKYARAIYDEDEQRWVSDAQVAEITFTAFTSRRTSEHITARLIVRRVKRLNPKSAPTGQGELFSIWRHHAVFTDSREQMLDAEATHRDHAIVEQTFSDLKAGALAHMPSSSFAANSAWTVVAAIAFNLTRATGTLTSKFHAKATTATIRAQLITVPGRIARSARKLRLHLPQRWPWEHHWNAMFTAAYGPARPAT